MTTRLVLASSSKTRRDLILRYGYHVDSFFSPDIDESPLKSERPHKLAYRLAHAKALKAVESFGDAVIIGADTVACVGTLVLPKAMTQEDARFCLDRLSGRRHHIHTGLCVLSGSRVVRRVCSTKVKMKKLTVQEKELYIQSGQWHAKAGGYGIQSFAACFVEWCSGCEVTNIAGLPANPLYSMLLSFGVAPTTIRPAPEVTPQATTS